MHTALMEASMDGHVEVAKLLLDSGAQVCQIYFVIYHFFREKKYSIRENVNKTTEKLYNSKNNSPLVNSTSIFGYFFYSYGLNFALVRILQILTW